MKKAIVLFFLFNICLFFQAKSSHIFGGELGYTHITGYTYEITLVLYGDCSGSSFPSLPTAVPKIGVYNGTSAYTAINLNPGTIFGLEVTPVCPSEVNNTSCKGGTLPGVAKFEFKGQVTLGGPSADWQFVFDGNLGGTSAAGRSGAITNIVQGANSSVMQLVATLNNTSGPNNCSVFTSIPTPFMCINSPQQYNQGAIDPDGDVLDFSLIPGLTSAGNVTYTFPYTYDEPLATAAGSFVFNGNNGQMSFTPNAIQNSLVVNKVTETRGGTVVGSTMREMTILVLNNCNNQSPTGNIANYNTGQIDALNQLVICNSTTQLNFDIPVSDPDGQNIQVSLTGLPQNAVANIVGNNTPSPVINFSWAVPQPLLTGSYTFFATFQDDGCPLSSKQTIAFTIVVNDPFAVSVQSTEESCLPGKDGGIVITANSGNGDVKYSLDNVNYFGTNLFNGLSAGTYTVFLKDGMGCTFQSTITVNQAIKPELNITDLKDIRCFGEVNGSIELSTIPANGNFVYELNPGAVIQNNGLFKNLGKGNYEVIVKDNKGCADTLNTTIQEPSPISFTGISSENAFCDKDNGIVRVSANFEPAVFTLKPGMKASSSGFFSGLSQGQYTVTVTNENNCKQDTTIDVFETPNVFKSQMTQKDLPCWGKGYEGEAEVFVSGGVPPYTYLWSTQTNQTSAKINELYYGWYFVEITDAVGCEIKDTVYIQPGNCCESVFIPSAFTPNGDGVNDEFKLVSSTGMILKEFAVFNRWGQKVWLTRDQRGIWDGSDGKGWAEPGTYFYLLRYTCLFNGKTYSKQGDLTLIK